MRRLPTLLLLLAFSVQLSAVAAQVDPERELDATRAIENWHGRDGRAQERGPYGIREAAWRQHMPGMDFALARQERWGRECARRHLAWIRRELRRTGCDDGVFMAAVSYNAGLAKTLAGRAPLRAYEHAQRVVNLYLAQIKEPQQIEQVARVEKPQKPEQQHAGRARSRAPHKDDVGVIERLAVEPVDAVGRTGIPVALRLDQPTGLPHVGALAKCVVIGVNHGLGFQPAEPSRTTAVSTVAGLGFSIVSRPPIGGDAISRRGAEFARLSTEPGAPLIAAPTRTRPGPPAAKPREARPPLFSLHPSST